MESCARVVGVLQGYIEGETSPELSQRVSVHLDCCPSCQRRVAGFRSLFRSLNQIPRVAAPAGWLREVMARVRSSPGPATPSRSRSHLRLVRSLFWAASAAGIASAGAAASALYRSCSADGSLGGFGARLEGVTDLGRLAFYALAQIRGLSSLPGLALTFHTSFGGSAVISSVLLFAALAGAFGVLAFTTVRILLDQTGR